MEQTIQDFVMVVLVEKILPILVTVLLGFAAETLRQLRQEVRQRVGSAAEFRIREILTIAVNYAEQVGLRSELEHQGKEKLALAVEAAQQLLNENGLTGIDVNTLIVRIEALIREGVHKTTPAVITAEVVGKLG
jgi:hypothetical protein